MTNKWSHLPNAEHIDWILDTLKENPEAWGDATDAAWRAAWDVSRAAAWNDVWRAARNAAMVNVRDASRDTALDAALDAAWNDVWDAVWDVVAALIAWDDSSKLLDMSVEEVSKLGSEGYHAAVLLLPAVIVKHELKENKMTKREWQIEMANKFAKRDNEPVAWLRYENEHWRLDFPMVRFYTNVETPEIPLYTTPELARKLHLTKTLTDEEILQVAFERNARIPNNIGNDFLLISFVRAILKKAQEK